MPPDLLGAHMSIAGGLHRALERGREVGCSVVQIFLKNQLQWTAKPYTPEDIGQFAAAWTATGIRTVFAHSSYLINLAAPAPAEWTRAVAAFHDELERAEALALPFVIIHPGSHKGEGLEAGHHAHRRGARRGDVEDARLPRARPAREHGGRRRDHRAELRRAGRAPRRRAGAGAARRLPRHLPPLRRRLRPADARAGYESVMKSCAAIVGPRPGAGLSPQRRQGAARARASTVTRRSAGDGSDGTRSAG